MESICDKCQNCRVMVNRHKSECTKLRNCIVGELSDNGDFLVYCEEFRELDETIEYWKERIKSRNEAMGKR